MDFVFGRYSISWTAAVVQNRQETRLMVGRLHPYCVLGERQILPYSVRLPQPTVRVMVLIPQEGHHVYGLHCYHRRVRDRICIENVGRPDDDPGVSIIGPHDGGPGLDQISLRGDTASPWNYRRVAKVDIVVHHRLSQYLYGHHVLSAVDKLLRRDR